LPHLPCDDRWDAAGIRRAGAEPVTSQYDSPPDLLPDAVVAGGMGSGIRQTSRSWSSFFGCLTPDSVPITSPVMFCYIVEATASRHVHRSHRSGPGCQTIGPAGPVGHLD